MSSLPHRPRFWWLTRLVPLVVGVIVLVAGFHWWLIAHFRGQVEAVIASWDPADHPHPDDLKRVTGIVPADEDNAAHYYTQAFAALPPLTPRQGREWQNRWGPTVPVPEDMRELVAEIMEQDRPALRLAREARKHQRADWGAPASDFSLGSPTWNQTRNYANHLSWALSLAHTQGDVDEALQFGQDLLGLSRASLRNAPSIISGLVASGTAGLAASHLRQIAWHRPPGLTSEQEREAWRSSRDSVLATIEALLDDRHDADLAAMTWKGEAVSTYGYLLMLRSRSVFFSEAEDYHTISAPAIEQGSLEGIRLYRALAEASTAGNAQSVLNMAAARPQVAQPQTLAGALGSGYLEEFSGFAERSIVSLYMNIFDRRATAVILAAKLFHADHGRWPESLDQLVPQYLPCVPIDPFASDVRSLSYRTDGPVPIVYSVGPDGVDDGGSSAFVGASRGSGSNWERRDYLHPLYLPSEALAHPDLNFWDYLLDPAAAVEAARSEKAAREEFERDRRAEREELGEDVPDDLDIEDQERQADGEEDK